MKKHKNLQPWLDYFAMLRQYEEKGFLEVRPEHREAYITRAALLTLTEPGDPKMVILALVRYVMARAAVTEGLKDREATMLLAPEESESKADVWQTDAMQQRAEAIVEKLLAGSYAIHVVMEDMPHDLLITVVVTHPSVWWKRSPGKERIEIVDYRERQDVTDQESRKNKITT
jgi:hypothetical protein